MLIRRLIKGAGILMLAGVLALVTLIGALWVEKGSAVVLPVPTGPFAVGRVTDAWVDDHALDALAPVQGTRREVLVWIWYPAARGTGIADDYMPVQMRSAIEQARGSQTLPGRVMSLLTRDVTKVIPHSLRDSAVSSDRPSFPVVIMRGGASAEVMNYSTLAEDLASHGYVVVGVDAPYRTGAVVFPDGRVAWRSAENNPELCVGTPQQTSCINRLLAAWTADIGFVLDRLERLRASDASGRIAGHLDLTRVGVFGHSFGGAQAAQFCHDDARCKAAIDIDGRPFGSVIQEGMRQPFMVLSSDHGDTSTDPEGRQIEADLQSIYDRVPVDRRVRVAIRGANHFTFSDDGALRKSRLVRGVLRVFGMLGIEGPRQLAVTTYCVRGFFDASLKSETITSLELASPLYPELQVIP